jgi:hypothetical protein
MGLGRLLGLGHDHRTLSPAALVREPNRTHTAGAHTRDLAGDLLDQRRHQVATRPNDQLLAPTGHEQLTIGEVAEVAGQQPTVSIRPRRRLLIAVVPGHAMAALDQNLANLALW